jgi:hypothetical protein
VIGSEHILQKKPQFFPSSAFCQKNILLILLTIFGGVSHFGAYVVGLVETGLWWFSRNWFLTSQRRKNCILPPVPEAWKYVPIFVT